MHVCSSEVPIVNDVYCEEKIQVGGVITSHHPWTNLISQHFCYLKDANRLSPCNLFFIFLSHFAIAHEADALANIDRRWLDSPQPGAKHIWSLPYTRKQKCRSLHSRWLDTHSEAAVCAYTFVCGHIHLHQQPLSSRRWCVHWYTAHSLWIVSVCEIVLLSETHQQEREQIFAGGSKQAAGDMQFHRVEHACAENK